MKKLLKTVTPMIIAFIIYIIYTGSLRIYDIVTGIITAIFTGILLSSLLVENWRKSVDVKRFFYLIKYTLRYFLIDEVKAHITVIKLGLSPKINIKPGIVRIPVKSRSDYALTLLSISITNTPGTVVVDIDKDRRVIYVNWINITTTNPIECYKEIAQTFDNYATTIFD